MLIFSSFSRRHHATVIIGCATLAWLSWGYFSQSSEGIVVSGADPATANGFYMWKGIDEVCMYMKMSSIVSRTSSRVPDVYDLVARRPGIQKDAEAGTYAVMTMPLPGATRRTWFLQDPKGLVLYGTPESIAGERTPPSTGWVPTPSSEPLAGYVSSPEGYPRSTGRGSSLKSNHLPEILLGRQGGQEQDGVGLTVNACGKRVPLGESDFDQSLSNPFQLGQGPLEVLEYPGTSLLLAINVAVAYYLWAKQISPDAVALSYALFWEQSEYWRLFTASFSHFDLLHIVFNAMGVWNTRTLETLLGSFTYLYLSLALVVTTIMLKILVKYVLVRRGVESQRSGQSLGFSCVVFAYMTYLAVAMGDFCPVGQTLPALCFKTYDVPMFGGLPSLPVNLGPFGSLFLAQVMIPRAGFLGHLSGIMMGYLMAWHVLGGLSTPILSALSVIFMLQHSKGWARNMTDFSLLLQGWAGGDAGRVGRARSLNLVFGAHVLLTAALLYLFTLRSGLAEVLALVVGLNAVQALKCCCCPDSVLAEHRYCVSLLKAYGGLSAILLLTDLLSFGAILGQPCIVMGSGVSETSRQCGLGLLIVAAVIHAGAVAACVEGAIMFRGGQTFMSSIGLGQIVTAYSINAGRAASLSAPAGTTTATASAGITSGRLYRGGGRTLGTAPSNRRGLNNAHRGRVVGDGEEGGAPLMGGRRELEENGRIEI